VAEYFAKEVLSIVTKGYSTTSRMRIMDLLGDRVDTSSFHGDIRV